ncbi:hypothetical protein BY996DRAFT_6584107 [Phakopsora pachyrhizi]|nr:hypothetical protein BY996DRAFT_6584107 [Phakopsora pachyrhizi]
MGSEGRDEGRLMNDYEVGNENELHQSINQSQQTSQPTAIHHQSPRNLKGPGIQVTANTNYALFYLEVISRNEKDGVGALRVATKREGQKEESAKVVGVWRLSEPSKTIDSLIEVLDYPWEGMGMADGGWTWVRIEIGTVRGLVHNCKTPLWADLFLGLRRSWPRTPLRMGMMEEAQQLLCSSKRQSQALGVGWQA